jgi:hypothetical protein
MLSSLKSPKIRTRAEAAAKQLLGFSPKGETVVLLDAGTRILSWLRFPKIQERAEAAAKQMRYFQLFSQRGSFEELGASARRAGFEVIYQDNFEARFRWAADADYPDFMFHVSRDDLETVSVAAESCRRDILGLVMNSTPGESKITIEAKSSLEEYALGRNADRYRRIMLTFPDFDDGMEQFLRRVRLGHSFMPADLV